MGLAWLSEFSFPCPSPSVFDKLLMLDWYDGYTSGLAVRSSYPQSFRFELLSWDGQQDTRVFALSEFDLAEFENVVNLLNQSESVKWPIWCPAWPRDTQELTRLNSQLNEFLVRAKTPESAIATDSMFKTILAAKVLTPQARQEIRTSCDTCLPLLSDNFDFWQSFLELPA